MGKVPDPGFFAQKRVITHRNHSRSSWMDALPPSPSKKRKLSAIDDGNPQPKRFRCLNALKEHFKGKGYTSMSGLQYGCDLVLYPTRVKSDAAAKETFKKVHSNFCVLLFFDGDGAEDGASNSYNDVGLGPSLDWRCIQSLGRSMPEVYKRLCCCFVAERVATVNTVTADADTGEVIKTESEEYRYSVKEMIVETDHKPFKSVQNKGIGVAGGENLPEIGIKKVFTAGKRETKEEREKRQKDEKRRRNKIRY